MLRSGISCLLSFTAFAGLFLSGCSAHAPVETIPAVTGMSGAIHGGQQPISGATIQLYAVGTAGDGSPATPLLTSSVTSNANGNFTITGLYTCPTASSLIYLTGTGGDPSPGIANSDIALMAIVGPCSSLTTSTFLNVNEITTVAAVYALAPFMSSFSAIGSGSSDAAALALAFTYAGNIANTSTGATPGTNLPANDSVPVAQVNTIADLLAACINSPGGVSGDTSICGMFFALTLPTGATPPTDAIGALLNLANNPTLNTAALYNLIPAASPFQPVDSIVPPDFSIRLIANSAFTVSPVTVDFTPVVVDFTQPTQTVTVTNGTAAAVNITSTYITGVNASDFAIVPQPATDCATTVPANSICTFTLSFIPSAAGARAAYFILANTSANPSIAVALAGSGTVGAAGPVTLTPSSAALYPPGFYYLPNPGFTLTNSGSTTLTINSIQTSFPGYAQTNNCGSSLAAGSSCGIYPSVTTYSVPQTATLTVIDDASTGPQTATLTFNEGGYPTYPPLVDFGHWAIGATGGEYLQILGPGIFGGYNFTIAGPNAADFSFAQGSAVNSTSCSYEYRFGSDCLLNIYYKPSALITSTAYVTIAGFGQFTITGKADPAGVDFDLYQNKPTTGTYYAPPITAFNVGSTPIGTPLTSSFTINNTGTAPLTFNPPVISGPNAADFAFPASCASPCSTLVFTPTGAGARSATLTYTDTTGAVTRMLALTGTGTTPAPVLTSSNSLLFTNVPAGTVSTSQTITVTAYNNDPIQATLAPTYTGGPQPFIFTGPTSCAATPCQLSVAYAPTASDASNGIENVYVIATDTIGLSSGNIQLAGQVAPFPYVTISPTSLTFNPQALNTVSAPQTVTFTNSGSTVLMLTFAVTPYGTYPTPDYSLVNNCPASLAINATCTVAVSFAPVSTTGSLGTNLVINGSNVTRYVSLGGTSF